MRRDSNLWWTAFFLSLVIGFGIGFVCGAAGSKTLTSAVDQRADLRKACVDGNDRACRIYEVEYGSRGLFP